MGGVHALQLQVALFLEALLSDSANFCSSELHYNNGITQFG
jgi:hypothetical protein